jgi:hypothetical protein
VRHEHAQGNFDRAVIQIAQRIFIGACRKTSTAPCNPARTAGAAS